MADPRGFLTIARRTAGYRPVLARVADHRDQALPPDAGLAGSQAGRCMDCGVPFCASGCPLGNLIPDWNELVRTGRWREASDRLHATNNFPELTGKLCPAPCEESCVLSLNDDPVTIKAIELAIVDRAFAEGWVRPQPAAVTTGRSVAVIGSGPAGLAAAQQLTRAGHEVTVFERDDAPGGLLRYGIPDFKLEKQLVDRRLEQMMAEGTRFETGVDVGAAPRPDRAARAVRRGGARNRRTAAPRPRRPGARPRRRRAGHALPDRAQPRRRRAARGRRRLGRRAPGGRAWRRRHQRRLPGQRAARGRRGGARGRPRRDAAAPARPAGDVAGVAAGAAVTPGARGGRVAAMALRDRRVRGRRPRPAGARPGRQHDRRRSGAGRDRVLGRRARSGVPGPRGADRGRPRARHAGTTCSRPATAFSAPT